VIALAVFVCLAIAVARGKTQAFDLAVRDAIHAWASTALTGAIEPATQLGGIWFLLPFGIVVAVWLLRTARRTECELFALAVAGAALVDQGMKLIFHRPRPEAFFGYPEPSTYSFPSGHSFVSYCFYLSLAEILIEPEWPRHRRRAFWIAAAALVLLIGFSRVYLGVHYPTDVIGGYTAAVAWTAMVRAAHHRWWN
jgi:undecaprenyl-diphosphatase